MLVGTFNQEKCDYELSCGPSFPALVSASWAGSLLELGKHLVSLRGHTKLTTECDSDGHDGDTVTSRRIVTQIYTPTKTKTLQSPKFEMRFSLLQIRVFCNVH